MADFIVIRVSDDVDDIVDPKSPYQEILRIFDSLDHKGQVAMLACAYQQKLRIKSEQRGQP